MLAEVARRTRGPTWSVVSKCPFVFSGDFCSVAQISCLHSWGQPVTEDAEQEPSALGSC